MEHGGVLRVGGGENSIPYLDIIKPSKSDPFLSLLGKVVFFSLVTHIN